MAPPRPPAGMRHRLQLRTKLLLLLLGIGTVPLAVLMLVGYLVSRDTILTQARHALDSITAAQAIHLGAELDKHRLLLRTIAGQLPESRGLLASSEAERAKLLRLSLPEDGVFDGLRLTDGAGTVLASVALRATAPQWPAPAPLIQWEDRRVVVHRDSEVVLAYLVAVPASQNPSVWLEGHVSSADFRRLFGMPEHLLPGVEAVIMQRNGQPVFGTHEHAVKELAKLAVGLALDTTQSRSPIGNPPLLVRVSAIAGSDWVLVAALPVDAALAALSRLRLAAAFGALLLLILIALVAVAATRSVTTPLQHLAAAIDRFGDEGEFTPLTRHPTDEVGTLINSFNAMATNLAQTQQEVEHLHAREMERAQQLATVGELASGIAHEIRNPLTGIRGALELSLRRVPVDDVSRPLLEEAQRQLARIEGTTTQLLQFARPPALKQILVHPNHLATRAAAVAAPRAATSTVTITVEPVEAGLIVRVDPELIVQVLVNLLLNAIDVTPPGGSVTLWLACHAPEALMGVRDRGPGVPVERRQEIFRPFHTTKHQGTGLGLSISRDIVARHGGRLTVSETPGGGATFVVALPIVPEDPAP